MHTNISLEILSIYDIDNVFLFIGADILLGKRITVRLVAPVSEFSRRPVAHTCGCVLEVPDSYCSFVDLRNDFSAILKSSVWSMDIV